MIHLYSSTKYVVFLFPFDFVSQHQLTMNQVFPIISYFYLVIFTWHTLIDFMLKHIIIQYKWYGIRSIYLPFNSKNIQILNQFQFFFLTNHIFVSEDDIFWQIHPYDIHGFWIILWRKSFNYKTWIHMESKGLWKQSLTTKQKSVCIYYITAWKHRWC